MTIRDLSSGVDVERIIFDHFFDSDIVLIEGYKKSSYPKILVLSGNPEKDLKRYSDSRLIAVVGDTKIKTDTKFFSKYDIKGVAEFLEAEFMVDKDRENIDLFVNSKHIKLNDYITKLLKNTITGILKSLKGVEGDIKDIDIKYRKR